MISARFRRPSSGVERQFSVVDDLRRRKVCGADESVSLKTPLAREEVIDRFDDLEIRKLFLGQ